MPRPVNWSLYPRKVRVWHFIVLPTLTMGMAILLARFLDPFLPEDLAPLYHDLYHALRSIVISLVMASVITWLAIAYRRQYEARLRARNEALESTREFLTRIIEGSGEAIVTLDAGQRITSWNRAADEIYGWKAVEMLGQDIDRLLPSGRDAQLEKCRVEEQIRSGRMLRDYQTTHVYKDGTPITVSMTRSPFHDADGGYEGSTAIVRDVTALVEMERRLREQDRLAAVGRLAAQVAHEIKNPLAGIRGACEVMYSRLEEQRGQEIAQEIVRQIDRLNRTVEDLLLFARPATMTPASTDLHDLIDRVVGLFQEDRRASNVEVVREYAGDLPRIDVDPEQMNQVFFNVLLNAAQAMDYEGTVTIGTRLEVGRVTVTVRDSGPGLPGDATETIFEPFYTTRAQGTGLGLAIVKKIVQAHHGEVEAATGPHGGAELRIRLPL